MGGSPAGTARAATGPIQHVVVIYQENHSFDNVLGRWCVQSGRCDGATTGRLHDGTTIPLSKASDLVAHVDHSREAQTTAIDGGAMDGFDLLLGCDQTAGYACYSQYTPKQIPNVIALARSFAVSDATFETSLAASWASHLSLVSSTPDLFWGDNPQTSQFHKPGPGWGCDSFQDAPWGPNAQSLQTVPACVPDQNGKGPYRSSPVAYVPTIMDRLDAAGLSWRLYAGGGPTERDKAGGYIWEVCPTFAECLDGPQRHADSGELPARPELHAGRGQLDRQRGERHRAGPGLGEHRHLHHVGRLWVLLRPRLATAGPGRAGPHDHRQPLGQARIHRPHHRVVRLDARVHRAHLQPPPALVRGWERL